MESSQTRFYSRNLQSRGLQQQQQVSSLQTRNQFQQQQQSVNSQQQQKVAPKKTTIKISQPKKAPTSLAKNDPEGGPTVNSSQQAQRIFQNDKHLKNIQVRKELNQKIDKVYRERNQKAQVGQIASNQENIPNNKQLVNRIKPLVETNPENRKDPVFGTQSQLVRPNVEKEILENKSEVVGEEQQRGTQFKIRQTGLNRPPSNRQMIQRLQANQQNPSHLDRLISRERPVQIGRDEDEEEEEKKLDDSDLSIHPSNINQPQFRLNTNENQQQRIVNENTILRPPSRRIAQNQPAQNIPERITQNLPETTSYNLPQRLSSNIQPRVIQNLPERLNQNLQERISGTRPDSGRQTPLQQQQQQQEQSVRVNPLSSNTNANNSNNAQRISFSTTAATQTQSTTLQQLQQQRLQLQQQQLQQQQQQQERVAQIQRQIQIREQLLRNTNLELRRRENAFSHHSSEESDSDDQPRPNNAWQQTLRRQNPVQANQQQLNEQEERARDLRVRENSIRERLQELMFSSMINMIQTEIANGNVRGINRIRILREVRQRREPNDDQNQEQEGENRGERSDAQNIVVLANDLEQIHRLLLSIRFIEGMFGGVVDEPRQVGLTKEQINQIPIINLKSKDDLTCTVCFDDLHQGEKVKSLTCLHKFHPKCIDEWLHRSAVCPNCKADQKQFFE